MISRRYTLPGPFRRTGFTDLLSFLFALAISASAVLLIGVSPERAYLALAPFIVTALATLLWYVPTFTVFFMLLMTVLIETYPQGFADGFTDRVGLWQNLSTLGLRGVPLSPAEIMMAGGIVIFFVRGLATQTLTLNRSPLLSNYTGYLLAIAIGLAHGAMSGGNMTTALWEIRAQVYAVVVFFLVINQLHSRKNFDLVGWFIILGIGFKGLQGTWRYFVTLGGSYGGETILEHDEAFFFPAYYLFVLLLHVFGGSKRQKACGLGLLPFVMIADFANKRRTSTGSLVIAVIALVVILFIVFKEWRFKIVRIMSIILVLGSCYAVVFWNSNAKIAQPIRAVRSAFTPDERDRSSNLYREQENLNISTAVASYPIFGQGLGIPMKNVAGMVNLESIDPFIMYRPHNSILWVWWRMGIWGTVLFWSAVGMAIIRSCFVARSTGDPYIRRWVIYALSVTILMLMISWWDMGLYRYRIVTFTWIILGVAEIVSRPIVTRINTQPSVGANSQLPVHGQ